MLGWILRQIDSLIGVAIAAIAGLAASQLLAFIQQYQQRLGGHLDEARLNLQRALETGGAGRQEIARAAADRVAELEAADQAIRAAGVFSKPIAFLQHLDGTIADGTLQTFQPALPLDPTSLAYGGAGIVLAWILYNGIKAPFRRRGATQSGQSSRNRAV